MSRFRNAVTGQELLEMGDVVEAKCLDCGKPYGEFGLDMVLSDEQWLMLHPEKDGLLCACCIVRRAERLLGATIVRATIEGLQPLSTRRVNLKIRETRPAQFYYVDDE